MKKEGGGGRGGCCTGRQSSKKHDATSLKRTWSDLALMKREKMNFLQNASPTCKE